MMYMIRVLEKFRGFMKVYEGLRGFTNTRGRFFCFCAIFLSRIMTYRDVLERVYEGLSKVYDSP